MKKDFESYFTRESIIKLLCKYRLKAAKKKHAFQMIRDISSSDKSLKDLKYEGNNCPKELSELLPPRRTWIRPERKTRNSGVLSDSQKVYEYSIQRKIKSTERKVEEDKIPAPEWLLKLNVFIEKIQKRAQSLGSYKFEEPDVKPIKKENKRFCTECRPISINSIEDRVLISITAKYFTQLFDEHFHESAFAFRSVKKGVPARTHHDTIEKIHQYLKKNKNKEIFVAECDIMKFFDCISHELALSILKDLTVKFKLDLNENAYQIFVQYLESYSFNKNVLTKNGTEFFLKHNIPGGEFGWKKKELQEEYYDVNVVGENFENVSIGVPQGGAISCFISNLVLHLADEELENNDDKELLYMRFCDDMVLLHTDGEKCKEYLEKYKTALVKLKLLVHKPQTIMEYNKDFWDTKSKAPYKWGDSNINPANVPWLSFVGYQIRYDGAIRLRKKALEKELEKQKEECRTIARALLVRVSKDKFKNINEISRKSKSQQLFALENRLISMSVGRVRLYELNQKQTQCWTNGFKLLNKNNVVARQLKMLDSNRMRQLYNFKKKIANLTRSTDESDEGESNGRKKKFHSPFSYHGFLNKNLPK